MLTAFLICAAISFVLSLSMAKSLRDSNPDLKSYGWGYFVGWMGFFSGLAFGFGQLFEASRAYDSGANFHGLIGILSIASAASHFFVVKRNRWGWIVAVILQFNLVLWVINFIYLKNRWGELSGGKNRACASKLFKSFNGLQTHYRLLVAGGIFWAVGVLVFVYFFEPFGGYVSSSDWGVVVKVILFPPFAIFLGFLLYLKVVHGGSNYDSSGGASYSSKPVESVENDCKHEELDASTFQCLRDAGYSLSREDCGWRVDDAETRGGWYFESTEKLRMQANSLLERKGYKS